jgi:hypothetical protein
MSKFILLSTIEFIAEDGTSLYIKDIEIPEWIQGDESLLATHFLSDEKRAALSELVKDPIANRDKFPQWFQVVISKRPNGNIGTLTNWHNGARKSRKGEI